MHSIKFSLSMWLMYLVTVACGEGDNITIDTHACDSCPDKTDIVCNAEGYAFPNLCFALCIGVPKEEIQNCSSSLKQEVEEAFTKANAHCLNATCGAECGAREGCGWDSSLQQCTTGETTSEEELSMGNCTEFYESDECRVYTCGINCSTAPRCGWDTDRMTCTAGHTTDDNELFLGKCDASAGDFDMCAEFRPCLNGGDCTTTGDYRFTCKCPPGFSGMVCETDNSTSSEDSTSVPIHDNSGKTNTQTAEDDDPFGGMFKGGSVTAGNAMVLSIIVLLVSVIASAGVLYYRRRKLRRDAVTLDSYVEGYVKQAPRRKLNLHRGGSMASIEMEFDDNREVLGIGVDDKPLKTRNGPVPAPRNIKIVGAPQPPARRVSMQAEHEMMKCTQCGTEAPLANGSIDDSDMKWYCNVCWRVLDESKTADC